METSLPKYLITFKSDTAYDITQLNPLRQFFASLMDRVKNGLSHTPSSTGLTEHHQVLVLLADDDQDDRQLFQEVLAEIDGNIKLQIVEDGMQLMEILHHPAGVLPDVLFLDLNMPGKNGKECLLEINNNKRLKNLPVIIYSTSGNAKDIEDTYGIGAHRYIRKPNTFSGQISVIQKVFSLDLERLGSH